MIRIRLDVPDELLAQMSAAALAENKSLKQWIVDELTRQSSGTSRLQATVNMRVRNAFDFMETPVT